MHEMQTIVTVVCGVCPSVCLSCGSTRLYCVGLIMAKRIKMQFGVNAFGGPWNIVLDMGSYYSHISRELGKNLPIMDPLHISGTAELMT